MDADPTTPPAVGLAQFQCDSSNWPGSRFGRRFTPLGMTSPCVTPCARSPRFSPQVAPHIAVQSWDRASDRPA